TATEEALAGRPWSADTVAAAARVLATEGTPIDDQRASAAYRSAMLSQALPRLWHEAHTSSEGAPA
ncbi:MAG: xanthine dehydrogenase small subunit, partial [Nocardioides sp.]